jgi:hypothetical protein
MTNVKIIPSSCRKQVTVTMPALLNPPQGVPQSGNLTGPVSLLGHVFRLFMRLRRINVTVTLTVTNS